MTGYRLTPAAAQDLRRIHARIAADNPHAAAHTIRRIRDRAEIIAEFPGSGRPRPELPGHLQSVPEGRYILFYAQRQGVVTIVRVIEGERDIPAQFH